MKIAIFILSIFIATKALAMPSEPIDLGQYVSYGTNQDLSGTTTLNDTATSITLTGNNWKAVEVNYQVTENTILEFDFSSDSEGEIHGVGLDDNLVHNTNQLYQIHGVQNNWALQSENNNYQGSTQRYRIRVGYNSNMLGFKQYLSLVSDDDRPVALGNSTFSNIRIYEDVPQASEFINLSNNISYGSSQDLSGTTTLNDTATSMTLTGNNWKAVEVNYQVTENTVLEFDFVASGSGESEIHGIGLDDNLTHNTNQLYQIHGTQDNWGLQSENNDYHSGKHSYRIRVGQNSNMLGFKRYLTLVNDDDRSVALGRSWFGNIRIYERTEIENTPEIVSFDIKHNPYNHRGNRGVNISLVISSGEATINWGDGIPDQEIQASPTTQSFSYIYPEGHNGKASLRVTDASKITYISLSGVSINIESFEKFKSLEILEIDEATEVYGNIQSLPDNLKNFNADTVFSPVINPNDQEFLFGNIANLPPKLINFRYSGETSLTPSFEEDTIYGNRGSLPQSLERFSIEGYDYSYIEDRVHGYSPGIFYIRD